jgi:hypothetical protein
MLKRKYFFSENFQNRLNALPGQAHNEGFIANGGSTALLAVLNNTIRFNMKLTWDC